MDFLTGLLIPQPFRPLDIAEEIQRAGDLVEAGVRGISPESSILGYRLQQQLPQTIAPYARLGRPPQLVQKIPVLGAATVTLIEEAEQVIDVVNDSNIFIEIEPKGSGLGLADRVNAPTPPPLNLPLSFDCNLFFRVQSETKIHTVRHASVQFEPDGEPCTESEDVTGGAPLNYSRYYLMRPGDRLEVRELRGDSFGEVDDATCCGVSISPIFEQSYIQYLCITRQEGYEQAIYNDRNQKIIVNQLITQESVQNEMASHYLRTDVSSNYSIEIYDLDFNRTLYPCQSIQPPPPPNPPKQMTQECCPQLMAMLVKVYRILGGDNWYKHSDTLPGYTVNPETLIREFRENAYSDDQQKDAKEITPSNVLEAIAAIQTVSYYRSGHHRYPAKVPESLTEEGNNDQTTIYDAASWQEWLIKQLDALHGSYPIKLNYKNAEGNQKELKFQNQAEMLAEVMGLLLSINADTDMLQDLSLKIILETIAARIAASNAFNYAKANSDYLGYRFSHKPKDITIPVNPNAKNLKDFMQESTQKMEDFQCVDKDTIVEILRELLTGVGIVKGAFYRPFNIFRNDLPGERIKEDKEGAKTNDDQSWTEFVQGLEHPTTGANPPNTPTPNITNLNKQTDND